MIILPIHLLKPSYSKYQNLSQNLGDRAISTPSRRWSTFLVAGLAALVIGQPAIPVFAQSQRIIAQTGDENSTVREVQAALIRLRYLDIPQPTLRFGSLTQQAVQNFQRDYNLPITGIVDNVTADAIYARDRGFNFTANNNVQSTTVVAKIGDSDSNNTQIVRELQTSLRRLNYFQRTPTGLFREYTRQVVQNFQRDYNLPITGIVDNVTADAIYAQAGGFNFTANINTNVQQRLCTSGDNRNLGCAYVVLVPGDNSRLQDTRRQLRASFQYSYLADSLNLETHPRGLFIRVGQFRDRAPAEELANQLRNSISPNFRVEYLPNTIITSPRN